MLLDLLKKRYSCRNFSNKKISDDIICYILECGRLSASGGNDQPCKKLLSDIVFTNRF